MNFKNFIIFTTRFTLTLLVGAFIASPAIAYAENLVVDFDPNPLFEQNNFLPGDISIGKAKVTNNSGSTQTVITESINGFDADGLGGHLNLTIIDSDSVSYFTNTLAHFLSDGEVTLGTLDNGESKTYTFTVSFININDNEYQGKSLGFDVCVGFEGGETNCGDTVVGSENDTGGGGSSGGGGTSTGTSGISNPPTSLDVFNEETIEINTEDATAMIEWNSNLLSTSQVIYGKQSEGSYSLNLAVDPYFGYPLGTVEDPVKVIHHSVQLINLEVGQTYLYRVVSRASPPTIGFERTFTISKGGDSAIQDIPEKGKTKVFAKIKDLVKEDNVQKIIIQNEEESSEEIAIEEEPIVTSQPTVSRPILLATIGSVITFGTDNIIVGLLVAMFVGYIIYILIKRRKNLKKV